MSMAENQVPLKEEDIDRLLQQADVDDDQDFDDDIIVLTDELLAGWSDDLDAFIEKLLAE